MKAYSMDLLERVLADCDDGMETRQVAVKYRVSESWIRRLKQRRRETGETAPRPCRNRQPAKWLAYAEAYEAALERCSTQHAPWFVVPSDRKWYRNWAVAQLLVEHLRALGLSWPAADFDVEAERMRLAAT